MKKLLLSLFSLIASFAVSHATLVTFDFVYETYGLPFEQYLDSGTEIKSDPVTITLFKDAGTNGMRFYHDGLRFHKSSNAGFTVAVPNGCKLTEIRMEDAAGSWSVADNVGTYDPNTYTWTGQANSVTFNFLSTSTKAVGRLQVTYEGTPQKQTYPVTIGTYDQGMLQVFSGSTYVSSGALIEEGSPLSVMAIPYDGYEVTAITANGVELALQESEGTIVAVTTVTGPTELAATFASKGVSYQTPSGTTHDDKYLTGITTTGAQENISVAYDAHPGQVYNLVEPAVTAAAGSEFTLNLVAHSLGAGSSYTPREDMRYNLAYIFADWNGTGEFTLLTTYGLLPPSHNIYGNYDEVMNIAMPVTVPADVAIGTARLRVIYSNAWDVPGTDGALRPADGHTVAEVDPNTAYINQGIAYDIVVNTVASYTVTFETPANGSISVMNGDAALESGALVAAGTQLVISATPAAGYVLSTLTANGTAIESGATYTVGEENVVIAATFVEKPKQSILVIGGESYNSYSYYNTFRFDDAPLGSHTNGTNDATDLRSRNFTYSAWVNIKNAGGGVVMGSIQSAFTNAVGPFLVKYQDGKLVLDGREATVIDKFEPAQPTATTDEGTALDEWVFITVVADQAAGKVTLYKNAKEISSYNTTYGVGLLPDESSFFVSDQAASIAISEVQLWNKALTVDEIKDSYNLEFETAPEGLVACYRPDALVEGSTTELRNLGTEGTTTAKVIYGRYRNSGWEGPLFEYQTPQEFQFVDEFRTLATVNVTVNQPEEEGCSVAVTGEDGREIAGQANLYEYLTIVPQIAEGVELKTVDVEDASGIVNYTLDQLVPVRANSDMTIGLTMVKKYTVTANVTNGTATASVDDAEAQEIPAEGLLVNEGSKVVVTLVPATEGQALESFTVNEVDGMESLVENAYTIEAIDADYALAAAFAEVQGPKQSILVTGGDAYSTYSYYNTFRFDDAPLGSHTNGTNDATDLRSRNLTYSAWVNIKKAGGGVIMGNIQSAFTDALGAFAVKYKDGKLVLDGRDATVIDKFASVSPTATTDEGTALDEWVFITVVADQAAGKVTLYKNAKEISSYNTTYGVGLLPDESSFFISDRAASIAISEVQLWNKALTAEEIKDTYNFKYETAPEGLVAYYQPGEFVEGSTTELRNLGTEGTTTAKVIYGQYYYDYSSWSPLLRNQQVQDIQLIDEYRTLATVNVTVNQPEIEGCSLTVTGEDGREIAGEATLYEYLTIVPQIAEGVEFKTVNVTDAEGTVKYALDQLVPVRANSDVTIELSQGETFTLTASVVNGTVTASVNDGAAQEIPAEGLSVEEGSKVVLTLTPAGDKYQLKSFTVNEVDNMENVAENVFTIEAIAENTAVAAEFGLPTYHLSVVNPERNDRSYYGEFRNNMNVRFEYNDEEGLDVEEGTLVVFVVVNPAEPGYSNLSSVTDNGADISYELFPLSNTEQAYMIAQVTEDHTFVITQDEVVGIVAISEDGENMLSYTDGALNVNAEGAVIEVIDMSGRLVAHADGATLAVDGLVPGVYVARATVDGTVYTIKFIKL